MQYILKLSCLVLLYLFQVLTGQLNVAAQSFPVDTILNNGSTNKFINLVFMGDGYQSGQLSTYITNVKNSADYLLNISPFLEYKNYFNVFAIKVPSTDAGTDHPANASDVSEPVFPAANVNTYFNSTFDYFNIHRLLVPINASAINSVVINNFPLYDQNMMLVNSPYYGGSGGSTATASLDASSNEIMVHELGHSFAGLADEYYAGDFYAAENTNMTQQTNPALVKWKNWMGYGGVGIYQHCCGGSSAAWYRPHNGCKMRYLGTGYPFCPVCREDIVERIHQLFGTPVLSSQPNQTTISYCNQALQFKLVLIKPDPNTLRIKWKLNGKDIALNIDSISVSSGMLNNGSNTLSVQILDTTAFIRDASHTTNHTYTVNWTINYNSLSPAITANDSTTFCQGDSVILTASPANSYLWSNNAITKSITVKSSGNYSVTLSYGNGCSVTSSPKLIKVHPLPEATITPGGKTSFCEGDSVKLTASSAKSYLWSNSMMTKSITVKTSGDYTVTVTDSNRCSNTSSATPVIVNSLPEIPTIGLNGTILKSSSIMGNQWYWNGNIINGATSQTYTPAKNGNYTVVVTDNNGCSATSALYNYNLINIQDLTLNNSIIIIPNPNNGIFRIETKNAQFSKIKIFNTLGEIVYETVNRNSELDVSAQIKGIYFIEVYTQERIYNKKLIIQ